ncbi:MAG: hypothetical protein K6G07_08275, partial [Lachnospiraceae bacterium]|nr:hypothetical protein [Lachnospiraceae bacterium]
GDGAVKNIYEAPAGTSGTNVTFKVEITGVTVDSDHTIKASFEEFRADWTTNPTDVTRNITVTPDLSTIDPAQQMDVTVEYTVPNLINENEINLNRFLIYYCWKNEGDPGIVEEASRYIYAYSYTDDDDLKEALAKELYARFIQVSMFGTFDLPIGDINADNSTEAQQRFDNGVDELKNRINITSGGDITCSGSSGGAVQDYVTAMVNWGRSNTGDAITSTLRVYKGLPNNNILVCTDFNESTGTGTSWYRRDMANDFVRFTASGEDGVAINVDDYGTVKVGGNGCTSVVCETEGVYTLNISYMSSYSPTGMDMSNYRGMLRVLKNSEYYLAVAGSGETQNVGNLKSGDAPVDSIFRSGDDAEAIAYVGNSTLTLKPLTSALVGSEKSVLTDVTLKDASLSDGITIDKSDLNNVNLSFASNFYDTIPLTVTYSNGIKKDITIKRIGLVIGTIYTMDNGEGTQVGTLNVDCNGSQFQYNYDYNAGQQILIYAIYYHPTNDRTVSGSSNLSLNVHYDDGRNTIIPHASGGYAPAANGGVATTVFVLGYAPAAEGPDANGVWGNPIISQNVGGLSATVINSGYDGEDSYGGTQIGSGKGVYWDGQINWYQ